jgi:hypothetical protein
MDGCSRSEHGAEQDACDGGAQASPRVLLELFGFRLWVGLLVTLAHLVTDILGSYPLFEVTPQNEHEHEGRRPSALEQGCTINKKQEQVPWVLRAAGGLRGYVNQRPRINNYVLNVAQE